jgi:hypothetical protein
LVPGKPFQPSLMFVGKARSLPERDILLAAPLGYAPALLANIRLASSKHSTLFGFDARVFAKYFSKSVATAKIS